jgi:hypothetical protein
MKNMNPTGLNPTISFVTRVTKIRAGQGFKPCVLVTRPSLYADRGRLRGTLLARHAGGKTPPSLKWP